ncbi:eukaryotic translation initiation factor 2 subunit alpha homolog [Ziziphus jujuba]|nr:eukaryotic translation initiation factor 2 subunit alpha homolog [Ziziphus jujuba]XP_060674551.1 eukaryotic translation initiation factor 2 subunit alpha homolog [Ziziphus jujuba]
MPHKFYHGHTGRVWNVTKCTIGVEVNKQEQGISVLDNAIVVCTQAIEQHKGKLTVKEASRAVSERDDKLLAEHMAKLQNANEEVSGDEDSEEEEDTGMGKLIWRTPVVGLQSENAAQILTIIFF